MTLSAAAAVALPVAVATPAAAAPVAPAAGPLTTEQALSRARLSGRPVAVDAATTATTTLTAEPSGRLTLTEASSPVRMRVDGVWTALDATLHRNPDGTVTPTVAYGALTLSGGGSGPLAVMSGDRTRVALGLPVALPAPVLSGPSATYRDVVPGVDVVATADTSGGFSEVLVIKTPAAMADPLVRSLALSVTATGVAVTADAAGNIVGRDTAGRAVVTAPTPQMWDSTPPARTIVRMTDRTGRAVDAATGAPVTSTPGGPGEGAARGPLAVTADGHHIGLGLNPGLLRRPLHYPVYVDPTFTWSSTPGTFTGGWAVIGSGSPSTKYWKSSPSSDTDLQSGLTPGVDDTRRTLINFTIPSSIFGAGTIVNSAALNIYENWAWNCTGQKVDIYAPGLDLTSANANWSSWPSSGWGGLVNQQTKAFGYNSSCPANWFGFDVTSAVANDVHTGNGSQTFLIKADNEGTESTWKRYADSGSLVPTMQIQYDRAPDTPSGLSTSPTAPCTGSTLGDSSILLYSTFSDPDGGTVGEDFKLWKTSNSAVFTESDPNLLNGPSGSGATPYQVPASWFAANSGGAATSYSWQVRGYDFNVYSGWSATCSFIWDPTRPGAPVVTPPGSMTIGSPATFSVAKALLGSPPSTYLVQLNGGAPFSVAATNGNATFQVTPGRRANTVTVTALSAGNNFGDTSAVPFNAAPATTAVDGDLTGDGKPDLLTVGGGSLAAGLWLAPGSGTGAINSNATSLAPYGNGTAGDNLPSDFTGAQAITGHFTGSGLQDVLYYYPSTGGGGVLNGNGDGSPINANSSGSQHTVTSGTLQDLENSDNPRQLVNAGNLFGTGTVYPDLIGINGDPASGYYLDLYRNNNSTISWDFPVQVLSAPPSGAAGWNAWTLASTQTASGLDVFLWNKTSGDLYLWTNTAYNVGTGLFSYTQYLIKAGWNTTASAISAADINSDGVPDVWVTTGNVSVAHLVTNLTGGTGKATAQAGGLVVTADHTWTLHDQGSGPVAAGAAVDSIGTLHASGAGAAKWNTGDLFSPDVVLDGTAGTYLATAGPALGSGDFSVSAWVKPTATGGTVVSQDGVNDTLLRVYPNTGDMSWKFAMANTDTAGAAEVTIGSAANTVQLGVWVHLMATYKASTNAMTLFLNDVQVATGVRLTPWTSTGPFRVGAYRSSSTVLTGNAAAQVASVQTWNTVVTPVMTVIVTPPAPAFVQKAAANSSGTASLAVTPTASLGAGNRLVVQVGVWGSGSARATAVTDAAGDQFTLVARWSAADDTEQSVWTAPITAGAGSKPAITVATSVAADIGITALEYSGLSTAANAGAVDVTATATGLTSGAATVSSGATLATTADGEMAIGFYADSGFNQAITGGTGWTVRSNMSPNGHMDLVAEDKAMPSSGITAAATAGAGSTTSWLMGTVVFKTTGAPASLGFVQQASAVGDNVTSLAVPLASPTTKNNRLIVEVGVWESGAPTVAAVTDNAGDTFTLVTSFVAGDQTQMSVWTALVATGGTAPTITATTTGGADAGVTVLEYAGLSTASGTGSIDRIATGSGTTGVSAVVASAPTAAVTADGELALGFYADSGFNGPVLAGAGTNFRSQLGPNGLMDLFVEDLPVNTGATPALGFTTDDQVTWLAATVVFRHS